MNSYKTELRHHGILGQKWGKKNGPPYPLGGGDYSKSEKKAIYRARLKKNSIYNKKHFDNVLKKDTVLTTLSYDKDRTKDTDMYYAVSTKLDKHLYNAVFNRPASREIYDEDGNAIGTGDYLKYKIDNKVLNNIKVASEDSAAESFRQLYSTNRDFYNFVTDPERMQACFIDSRYRHKGYREARESLEKIRSGETPSSEDLQKAYRMFNYVIPSDGNGNKKLANDVKTQRAKFFNQLSKDGYGAVLDVNDGIYNHLGASSPVIVFDQKNAVLSGTKLTTTRSKHFSRAVLAGRKALGL